MLTNAASKESVNYSSNAANATISRPTHIRNTSKFIDTSASPSSIFPDSDGKYGIETTTKLATTYEAESLPNSGSRKIITNSLNMTNNFNELKDYSNNAINATSIPTHIRNTLKFIDTIATPSSIFPDSDGKYGIETTTNIATTDEAESLPNSGSRKIITNSLNITNNFNELKDYSNNAINATTSIPTHIRNTSKFIDTSATPSSIFPDSDGKYGIETTTKLAATYEAESLPNNGSRKIITNSLNMTNNFNELKDYSNNAINATTSIPTHIRNTSKFIDTSATPSSIFPDSDGKYGIETTTKLATTDDAESLPNSGSRKIITNSLNITNNFNELKDYSNNAINATTSIPTHIRNTSKFIDTSATPSSIFPDSDGKYGIETTTKLATTYEAESLPNSGSRKIITNSLNITNNFNELKDYSNNAINATTSIPTHIRNTSKFIDTSATPSSIFPDSDGKYGIETTTNIATTDEAESLPNSGSRKIITNSLNITNNFNELKDYSNNAINATTSIPTHIRNTSKFIDTNATPSSIFPDSDGKNRIEATTKLATTYEAESLPNSGSRKIITNSLNMTNNFNELKDYSNNAINATTSIPTHIRNTSKFIDTSATPSSIFPDSDGKNGIETTTKLAVTYEAESLPNNGSRKIITNSLNFTNNFNEFKDYSNNAINATTSRPTHIRNTSKFIDTSASPSSIFPDSDGENGIETTTNVATTDEAESLPIVDPEK
ncbi:ras guanine nucleotide exchange factor P-like [Bactrocera dorsalis]|uniref:Ras guanine nucleotide exchange factor P-like n=1 Tax=Bactrocera dorsalis TaxID=27457 RepID=A0ABM3JX09_BACDO|nr:ras guanine nucleotide exchange factor P-like [Bactrocera dorsalis]